MTLASLPKILSALKSSYGEHFLECVTSQLHQSTGADYTFIARLQPKEGVSNTLFVVAHGEPAANFSYALNKTPCGDVSRGNVCVYPKGVCALFPDDQRLLNMGIEGYVGTPLINSSGNVIGLVVALYESEVEEIESVRNLFELFSGRIAAEIERHEKEQQLEWLNQNLQKDVERRSRELQEVSEHLKCSQLQIAEHEKMASLGQLVAGVAHDVNTPLGVSILGLSTMQEQIKEMQTCVAAGKLTKTHLDEFLECLLEVELTLEYNLQRAAELIRNFKQVAVDYNTDTLNNMQLNKWFSALLTSLRPMMKKYGIVLELSLPTEEQELISSPSKLAQIITNLLSNAAHHAFPEGIEREEKRVIISLSYENDICELSVTDNGIGMQPEVLERVAEPFFTTKQGKGGTGLGMSIIHNIVYKDLKGEMEIDSAPNEGTCVSVRFPSASCESALNPNAE